MLQNQTILFSAILYVSIGCKGQVSRDQSTSVTSAKTIGGAFENSNYLNQQIPVNITSIDTSPGWYETGTKLLVTGKVYLADAKTPAEGILIYYYQTNSEGRYQHKPGQPRSMPPNDKGQTHGNIRGWVKTDSQGRYSFYTIRPGVYPNFDEPAHIHITVKEPNFNEYYIDDFLFDDDKFLTSAKRKRLQNRGGSGVLRLVSKNGLLVGERDIILGLNIPDYPTNAEADKSQKENELKRGLQIGEEVASFIPYHAWGPDKGTRTCPVCKYGWYHGIIYSIGNNPEWTDIRKWLLFLEQESVKREKYLKVFFVYGNENKYDKAERNTELENIGKELNLEKIALTYVPSLRDTESEINSNELNPDANNSFLIYKRSRLIGKFENFPANKKSFDKIISLLDNSINEYFKLMN